MIEIKFKIKKPIDWWYVAPVVGGVFFFMLAIFAVPWFREFMFISMFKEDGVKSKSFMEAIAIPLGAFTGIVLLYFRAKASDRQASIALASHNFEKTITYETQLDEAIVNLNTQNDSVLRERGLNRVITLIENSPKEFAKFGISELLKVGEKYSLANTMEDRHGNITEEWGELNTLHFPEINYFIFLILDAVQSIQSFLEKNDETAPHARFRNFKIYPPKGEVKFQIKNGYFGKSSFFNCSFLGVVFEDCDFTTLVVFGGLRTRIVGSVISEITFAEGVPEKEFLKFNRCYFLSDGSFPVDTSYLNGRFGSENTSEIMVLPISEFDDYAKLPAPRFFSKYKPINFPL